MKFPHPAAIAAAGLVVAGAYAGFVLGPGVSADDGPSAPSSSLAVPAPDVEFRTLHGAHASLEEFRGQVVLLNIWGTWCPPCIREIPHLVEVQAEIEVRAGTVIGLPVDSGSPADIQAFWRDRLELEPAYPLWMGTNREARRHFEAFGLPNTLIIDRDGIIRERFLGMVTRERLLEEIEAVLQPPLAGCGPHGRDGFSLAGWDSRGWRRSVLQGDMPVSNTDPFADGTTADNEWIADGPPHIMVVVSDPSMLEGLPTDPDNGGPWVMWKGMPYAHITIPTVRRPS